MTAGPPAFHVVPGYVFSVLNPHRCVIGSLLIGISSSDCQRQARRRQGLQEIFNMNAATFSRNNFRRAALASVVALGVFGASNGFAAGASTASTATVITPIAITKSVDLVFGSFARGAGGTVTVSTSGARTASGTILSTVNGASTAAKFDVTGEGASTYSIIWSGDTELTTGAGGAGQTMALARISDLTADNATSGEVGIGTLTTGAQSIYLGGTLTVGEAQEAGAYTGSVTATVEYN
jgi:hypothetical protein